MKSEKVAAGIMAASILLSPFTFLICFTDFLHDLLISIMFTA